MNRCFTLGLPRKLALAVGLLALAWASLAAAQMPIEGRAPPIPARAIAGVLRIVAPPEALINGQPARLAPGSRIRGQHNLIVMPATLVGHDLPVRYTLDTLGLVHEVWVLTEAEIAAAQAPRPIMPN